MLHVGATVGYNRETPQQVYDGCFTENDHVLASTRKSGTLRRFVFTSSGAAVSHPRPETGYVFTEKDWCGADATIRATVDSYYRRLGLLPAPDPPPS